MKREPDINKTKAYKMENLKRAYCLFPAASVLDLPLCISSVKLLSNHNIDITMLMKIKSKVIRSEKVKNTHFPQHGDWLHCSFIKSE